MAKKYYIIVSMIFISAFSATAQISVSKSLYVKEVFYSDGENTVFRLKHKFIMPGSVLLTVNSVPEDLKKDIRLDLIKGIFQFRTAPDSGSIIEISYWYIPLDLKTNYQLWYRSDSTLNKRKTTVYKKKREERKKRSDDFYSDNLKRSGSIFRGIEIGTNSGMRLQSGLRLQVSGKIMEGVDLTASLTDQNSPIQPEGNTQTLQEIDKIFITLKTKRFNTTFGDYVFESSGTEFASYKRKLQGATAQVKFNKGEAVFFAAASRGVFATNHFMGQEGNQGPYQLKGVKGERQIIILAGTERVWINGELIQRGEDRDYTIEYSSGQITFTRNRLITGDSRITVDFEYSAQNFQKEVFGVKGHSAFFDNRVQISASIVREKDDIDNPFNLTITDEYREILSKAGDNPDSALASGARFAGTNKGAYRKENINGKDVYKYVGPNNGDYLVQFSYVGTGRGDYSFKGYGIYIYEGEGKGSYLPIIFLPLATSSSMADVSLKANFMQDFSAGGEFALSLTDKNLFSPLNDNDNSGSAYNTYFKIKNKNIKISGAGLGKISLSGNVRKVGTRFNPMGRMSEIEHGRVWGTSEGTSSGEDIRRLKISYSPFKYLILKGEKGLLKRSIVFRSDRNFFSVNFIMKKAPKINFQREDINTKTDSSKGGVWIRDSGKIEWTYWGLSPAIIYNAEHKRDDLSDTTATGFKFNEITAKLGLKRKIISLNLSRTLRNNSEYSGKILEKNSVAETKTIHVNFIPAKTFIWSLMFTHRNKDYFDEEINDQKSDLADLKIKFTPKRGYLRSSLNYKFTSTSVSQMVRDTIKVGEGLGSYRFDEVTGEYVPDPDGDVIFRLIQTGDFMPVNQVRIGGDMFWRLNRIFRKNKKHLKALTNITVRSKIRIERSDRVRDFYKVNRLALFPDWSPDTLTVSASLFQQHDIEYRLPGKYASLRFRIKNNSVENNQLYARHFVNHKKEKSIRVKGGFLKKGGYFLEYQNKQDTKSFTTGSSVDRDIISSFITGEISYRPKQKIEFALKLKSGIAEDRTPVPVTRAVLFFMIPRVSYSIKERGRLRAEFEAGRISADPENRGLPFEMFSGDQPGLTMRWRILFTYKLSNHLQSTFNYRGRKEPWREKTYQTGSMEIRAFF